jgi:hypothetical protein
MNQSLTSEVTRSKTPEQTLPDDIGRLVQAVGALPVEHRTTLEPLLEHFVHGTRRRRQILTAVQESLGQLRLDMKYLMFDLEATRRERDAYQTKLEQR